MLHRRVRETRGNAAEHACARCGKRAREWAQIHGTDGLDIQLDYAPLCSSCHRRYDTTPETRAALSALWTTERRAALGERTKQMNADGKMGWALYNRSKATD